MGKFRLNATYGWLITSYENRTSQHIYALGEFIDNSISSYSIDIKGVDKDSEDVEVDGLEIHIDIVTNNDEQQYIKITDNAGGMSEKGLERAMQPGDTNNKKSTHINQYGVGMKFGIFWLGNGVQIHTRQNKSNEYCLSIEINKDNFNELAELDAEKCRTPTIEKSGTWIKITHIHQNKMLSKNDFRNTIQAIGWRYGGLLKRGLKIYCSYNDLEKNIIIAEPVESFRVSPYVLCDAAEALAKKRKSDFNKETFVKEITKKVGAIYNKKQKKIEEFTSGVNFFDTFITNKPLFFKCKWNISGKCAIVRWGILANKYTGANYSFGYKDLNGFTLIHKHRAIYHGPNLSSTESKFSDVPMHNYPIYTMGSGGSQTKMRIFGFIDMTGIESPEVNKCDFKWGELNGGNGRHDLNHLGNELYAVIQDILNVIKNEEESINNTVVWGKNGRLDEMQDALEEKFKAFTNIRVKETGAEVNIDIDDDIDIKFVINHVQRDERSDAFTVKYVDNNKSVEINMNTNHYLWKKFIFNDDEKSREIKSSLLYPLAISFAICKLGYDKTTSREFTKWAGSNTQDFDSFFNVVLKKLIRK